MDLNFTPEELAFRDEVRAFLKAGVPDDLRAKIKGGKRLVKDDYFRWHKALSEQGWLGSNWPTEFGGPGWTPVQKHIFEEECYAYGAPRTLPFGVNMVAPVIMKFGSQAQKDYYLPRILDLTDWWCQGYSEPGSGSDLASLRTSAVREGDHYIVNGQKTWTTLGQYADKIFCLVRTNPNAAKPQEGISFLLIDMETPGVTVRPIILLEGEHEVNEVWFDNVKVPVENLVGEENKGWTYAKYLLTHERTGIANVGSSKAALLHLKAIARDQVKNGRPLIEDPLFRNRIAKVEIDLMAHEMTNLRVLAEVQSGGAPGLESSILKIRGTEIRQEITDLARRAIGPYAIPFQSEALEEGFNGEPVGPDYAAPIAKQYFNMRKLSIYGGSNEIQKNIIAKAGLGL
ncbi:acyl-CoA dehydrogenase family protein [Nisaea sediminum]|uniref:acyl-CoA dehydrogenase family protein n=1 Tax=Nisaea sediminum TaxID=2775867 RepID=UPI0018668D96|nr:acyl-CoA dehydrogenase family protein [Nisaea sediminum]